MIKFIIFLVGILISTDISADMSKSDFSKLLVPSALFAVANSKYDKPEGTPYIAVVEPEVIWQLTKFLAQRGLSPVYSHLNFECNGVVKVYKMN